MAEPYPSLLLLPNPPYGDLFPDGLPLLPSSSELHDLDLHFDIDVFLRSPDPHHDSPTSDPNSAADGSAVSSSSSTQHDRSGLAPRPSSPDSSAASGLAVVVDPEVKAKEGKVGWSLKRKMEKDDNGFSDRRTDSDLNPNPRSIKFQRSEEASPPCIFGSGSQEEEKRRARLVRNRESAQLSRHRKKQYVEELEDKVRLMHSTINELNTKISYIMAENISLRQQLVGGVAPPPVYPRPGAMAPVNVQWIPTYSLNPQGTQVPLVPIPRLKLQKATLAPKAKKSEGKKGQSNTKRVASVSLMGLLFFILIVRGAFPSLNLRYGGYDDDEGLSNGRILCQAKSRILSVRGCGNGLNSSDDITLCSRQKGFGGGIDNVTGRKCENVKVGPGMNPKGLSSWPSPGSEAVFTQNSSESLPALLYVPRNGKHVKIDGNLIIHSVLASEKAIQQTESKQSLDKETGLAIAGNVMSALAISKAGKGLDLQHSKSYGDASDSDDTYVNNLKLTSSDGPHQQWFHEGMAASLQMTHAFIASLISIFPASSIMNSSSITNATEKNLPPSSARPGKNKNRRIMHPERIPLRGTTRNNTKQFDKSSERSNLHNNKPVSSVVVSVLADPRDAGDGEGDERISPKSTSRVFVVVLLDSIKWNHGAAASTTYPPNLRPYPLIGHLPQFLKNRHRLPDWFAESLAATPTNTFFVRRPVGIRSVITANPANVEHILRTRFDNYPKGPRFRSILHDFLGHGIFNSDGDAWRVQRKTASFEFNTKSLRSFVVRCVHEEILSRLLPLLEKSSHDDSAVDLQDVLERFAFDNICKVAFDHDPVCLAKDDGSCGQDNFSTGFALAFNDASNTTAARFRYVLPRLWMIKKLLGVGSERRLRQSIATVHGLAMRIIRAKKENRASSSLPQAEDLLSRFIANEDHSEDFLRDTVISFMLAGKDTISSALTWFFWLLCSRPDVEAKIMDEIRSIRARRPSTSPAVFDFEELRDMHYLHAAITESMRLYPPVPLNSQSCLSDDVLPDGTAVKKGWLMSYNSYAMGRMEAIWGPDCREYKPERWLDEGKFRPASPFKFPAFHAGPRICLGKEMAYIQMKSIVACVLERLAVELVDKEARPVKMISLTLRMKGGLLLRFRKRSACH
ncbi:hypothetical protein C4D60_Mb01t06780 [Musa balbisiana]|uniref:BZIP domain-containing protein n=1 Tax=Musa balbisiana TaxID=52838 RepID=A0A4V6T4G7_MUSBA|nr:hypothetical protein C4D60_Mb01t06780 [Musa balbisiana]